MYFCNIYKWNTLNSQIHLYPWVHLYSLLHQYICNHDYISTSVYMIANWMFNCTSTILSWLHRYISFLIIWVYLYHDFICIHEFISNIIFKTICKLFELWLWENLYSYLHVKICIHYYRSRFVFIITWSNLKTEFLTYFLYCISNKTEILTATVIMN